MDMCRHGIYVFLCFSLPLIGNHEEEAGGVRAFLRGSGDVAFPLR